MKKISIYSFLIGVLFSFAAISPIVKAQTPRTEDKAAIESQINQLVDDLRRTREKSVELNQSIEQYEERLNTTRQKIDNLNAVVDSRKLQSRERLRDIQLNEDMNVFIQLLFSSRNIVEFIQQAILLSQLQEEGNNRLYLAQQTVEELQLLKQEQEELLNRVTKEKDELSNEIVAIEQKRQALQQIIDQYPDVVEQIIAKKEQEATRNSVSEQPVQHSSQQQTSSVSTTRIAQQSTQETTTTTQPIVNTEITQPTSKPTSSQSELLYSISEFKRKGVVSYKGNKFTYYSELVLPGGGLNIPGRHVNEQGYVVDGDGYIVLANNAPIGTVVATPFGAFGKVYDRGTYGNHYDVYLR